MFLRNGWPTKGVKLYFQSEPLSEILTTGNLRHITSNIWLCTASISFNWDNFSTVLCRSCIKDTFLKFRFYTKKRVSIFWIFDQNFSWSYLVFNVFKATGLFLYILKISGKVFFGRIERDPWDEIDCVILLQIVFYIFVLSIICSKLAIETPEKGVKYVQS